MSGTGVSGTDLMLFVKLRYNVILKKLPGNIVFFIGGQSLEPSNVE